MIFVFIILLIIFIIGIKFNKDYNKDYLNKNNTTIINGLFIVLVFFSHSFSYIEEYNVLDRVLKTGIGYIGQLMVTTFLFFSGYGIYYSIKNKKNYMDSFFKNRFLKTFINFDIAVLLFLILNLILRNDLSISRVLLSFIGWDSIGNSNWYMFSVFILYLFIIFIYKILKLKDLKSIIGMFIITGIYIIIISIFKEKCWYDTLLVFPLGMLYCYYKDRIDKYIMNNKKYYKYLLLCFILFGLFYIINHYINCNYFNNIVSIFFVLTISLLMMKMEFNSKVFYFLGENLFWIYILERIPMIILDGKVNNVLFILISLIITYVLTLLMKNIKIFNRKN